MEVKYIEDKQNEALIEIDNATIVELLRAYLLKDDAVKFVAWKREHQTKNPVLKIKTDGKSVRKAISDAVGNIEKEIDQIVSGLK